MNERIFIVKPTRCKISQIAFILEHTYLQSRGPGAASIIEIRYNRMPVDSSSGRTRAHPLDIAITD
jgi:hypothetical protein